MPPGRGRAYIPALMSKNSFGAQATLKVGPDSYTLYRLDAVYRTYPDAVGRPNDERR